MEIWPIVNGLATWVPGSRYLRPSRGRGGTGEAEYCYNVWLKHITMLHRSGLEAIPSSLGELGPGGSLGVGLAGMLSGINHYYALDVAKYSNPEKNSKIFGDLVDLFKAKTPKRAGGWPAIDDHLDANLFPSHILTDELLARTLADERVGKIREALAASPNNDSDLTINHIAPWSDPAVVAKQSIDLIISHSVMEHVNDLEMSYKAMASWIRPGGYMSHQVDLAAHGVTSKWNGHRQYSELIWKIVVGTRPYLINREPCSTHLRLLKKYGFVERCCMKNYDEDGIQRSLLSSRWKDMSDDDFRCRGLYYSGQHPGLTSPAC